MGALLEFGFAAGTARSASPIVWRPRGAPAARERKLSSEENKVCITSMKCCLLCKNREEKIDLEASRYFWVLTQGCPKPVPMMSLMA